MDPNKNFTEDDIKKVTEFLNAVAKNAEFKVNTEELISYFKLLAYMQQQVLPKMQQHILEVKDYVEKNAEQGKTSKSKSK